MTRFLIFTCLLFSFTVNAELAVEFARNKTQMEWKGASHAKYDYQLKTIGLVWYNDNPDNNFGARIAYGKARATLPQIDAALPYLIIELKHAIDIEALYRHNLYGDTFAYYGIGYYFDNLPITSIKSDFKKDDWDNGIGWLVGIEHKMTKHSSIQSTFRQRNSIGASKHHTGALGSSHNSIGVSIRYIF